MKITLSLAASIWIACQPTGLAQYFFTVGEESDHTTCRIYTDPLFRGGVILECDDGQQIYQYRTKVMPYDPIGGYSYPSEENGYGFRTMTMDRPREVRGILEFQQRRIDAREADEARRNLEYSRNQADLALSRKRDEYETDVKNQAISAMDELSQLNPDDPYFQSQYSNFQRRNPLAFQDTGFRSMADRLYGTFQQQKLAEANVSAVSRGRDIEHERELAGSYGQEVLAEYEDFARTNPNVPSSVFFNFVVPREERKQQFSLWAQLRDAGASDDEINAIKDPSGKIDSIAAKAMIERTGNLKQKRLERELPMKELEILRLINENNKTLDKIRDSTQISEEEKKERISELSDENTRLRDMRRQQTTGSSVTPTRGKFNPLESGSGSSTTNNRVRNKKTGQMGTLINGVVVPD